jgi:protein-disulfide isomerase
MNKKATQDAPSKRQVMREQRVKKQRNQRLFVIIGLVGVALVFIALIAYPMIQKANTPVGEFTRITPEARQMVDGRAIGDKNAKVVVEVFEDFQCPACQAYTMETEPKVLKEYAETGKIYYIFRNFPFIDDQAAGKESDQAANAAMCAAEQSRFWDYHEMLFTNWQSENKGAFNDNRLVAFADALGLDMNQFNTCFKANKFKDEINSDLAKGQQMQVSGTPTIFINGVAVAPNYVPTFDQMKEAIDKALAGN